MRKVFFVGLSISAAISRVVIITILPVLREPPSPVVISSCSELEYAEGLMAVQRAYVKEWAVQL